MWHLATEHEKLIPLFYNFLKVLWDAKECMYITEVCTVYAFSDPCTNDTVA